MYITPFLLGTYFFSRYWYNKNNIANDEGAKKLITSIVSYIGNQGGTSLTQATIDKFGYVYSKIVWDAIICGEVFGEDYSSNLISKIRYYFPYDPYFKNFFIVGGLYDFYSLSGWLFFQLEFLDQNGNTSLMFAIFCEEEEEALKLIECGADLDIQRTETASTALMAAIEMGQNKVAIKLIEAGAKLDLLDANGNTALMLAIAYNHKDIVLKLIEYGADPYVQSQKNTNPGLVISPLYEEQDFIKMIRAQKVVNINHPKTGNTALTIAIEMGQKMVALKLIEYGAKLDLLKGDKEQLIPSLNSPDKVAEYKVDSNDNNKYCNVVGLKDLICGLKGLLCLDFNEGTIS